MRKIIIAIFGIVLIIGAVIIAQKSIHNKEEPEPIVQEEVINTAFVDVVKNTTIPITIKASGNLIATERVVLYSEVEGIFKSSGKAFRGGQKYEEKEPLILIENSEYHATVQALKSEFYNKLTSIMPDLRLDHPKAFKKWKRYLRRFRSSSPVRRIPKTYTDREHYFIASKGIYTSYYNLKKAEERLSKYSIEAPFDGIVTEAVVTEGTLIRSGQKLGQFIKTGSYEMEIAVGKGFADVLTVGALVTLSSNAYDYEGMITRINGSVDLTSQTITAYIKVTNDRLKEGMYLEASIKAPSEKNAIEIDRNLVQPENKVFIVQNNLLVLLPVHIVHFSETTAVIKGLENETLLVRKPIPGAYPGMSVKVHDESYRNSISTKL